MKDKIERWKRILRIDLELAKERECLRREIWVEIEKLINSDRVVGFRFGKGPVRYGKITKHYPEDNTLEVESNESKVEFFRLDYDELVFLI